MCYKALKSLLSKGTLASKCAGTRHISLIRMCSHTVIWTGRLPESIGEIIPFLGHLFKGDPKKTNVGSTETALRQAAVKG